MPLIEPSVPSPAESATSSEPAVSGRTRAPARVQDPDQTEQPVRDLNPYRHLEGASTIIRPVLPDAAPSGLGAAAATRDAECCSVSTDVAILDEEGEDHHVDQRRARRTRNCCWRLVGAGSIVLTFARCGSTSSERTRSPFRRTRHESHEPRRRRRWWRRAGGGRARTESSARFLPRRTGHGSSRAA